MKNIIAASLTLFIVSGGAIAQSVALGQGKGDDHLSDSQADSQYAQMTILQLVSKAKTTKDSKQSEMVALELNKRTPSSKQEISALFELLGEYDPEKGGVDVRQALYNVKAPELAPEFAKRINGGSFYSRGSAIGMVANLKYKPAVPKLIDLVKHYGKIKDFDEGNLQVGAAAALGEIGDERGIPVLIEQFGKMDGEAEQALSKFGVKILPQMLDMLRKSTNDVERQGAGEVISRLKEKSLVPMMWKIAQNDNDRARGRALQYVISLCDESTSPSLDEVKKYVYSNAKMGRHYQIQAVELAKKSGDVEYLISLCDDSSARNSAITALGELNAKSAVPTLERLLSDSNEEVRYLAAQALKRITGRDYNWKTLQ